MTRKEKFTEILDKYFEFSQTRDMIVEELLEVGIDVLSDEEFKKEFKYDDHCCIISARFVQNEIIKKNAVS